MSQSWFRHCRSYVCDKWSSLVVSFFFHNELILIFASASSPLSVKMVLFTVTGATSPVFVNTNGSVYTNGCYTACLVVKPIMLYSYAFLFNCTMVGQALVSMTALTKSLDWWVDA